jgi:hypothetical protein
LLNIEGIKTRMPTMKVYREPAMRIKKRKNMVISTTWFRGDSLRASRERACFLRYKKKENALLNIMIT